ncbi:filamentation induced by cAMP protein Fic [Methanocorpusculum labreanum Z]|uniref:Filamentation induced by cAMP protein Fic n=1 Tax=Methanocorpusculum labreanum (strain ATCC 43576 / DSM 4855 / Z) TaxID=410358 RepID=A2SRX4_METLZ|nr:Fic family protein [Methanocorpusculum labreanum]ABN07080.1 filamentation induced by cAMP protein Fic [Methanocorpusculum labreanum Z]
MTDTFEKCRYYKKRIDALRPFPPETLSSLKEYFRIGLTYTSNAIEGNSLTESETKVLIEDGLTVSGKPLRDIYETLGHAKAYGYIYDILSAQTITEDHIKTLHRLFYDQIDKGNAGIYRTERVVVTGSHYPLPKPDQIPDKMKKYIDWFNAHEKTTDPVKFAALSHQKFVFIHPFIDGNGRVARLIMNLVLLRAGYQICIIPPILRHEYVESLELAHKDTKPFIEFIAERIVETEKDILRLFGESTSMHEGAKQINEGANPKVSLENEGVNAVLKLITWQPGLNTRDLSELTGKSRSSVERYIRVLKTNGMIEFRGAAKNGGYYPRNE